jgi:hypothetical protein
MPHAVIEDAAGRTDRTDLTARVAAVGVAHCDGKAADRRDRSVGARMRSPQRSTPRRFGELIGKTIRRFAPIVADAAMPRLVRVRSHGCARASKTAIGCA